MSRAKAAADRIELDAYYTPDWAAELCVDAVGRDVDLHKMVVLEPHVGGGAFARALKVPAAGVLAMDINPDAPGFEHTKPGFGRGVDFLTTTPYPVHAIVGNPPYRQAEAHVRHALSLASYVGFLLRLGFLESAKRHPFWQQHPASKVYVFTSRPAFTKGGTDSAAYGFFVWDARHQGPTELHWFPPRAR